MARRTHHPLKTLVLLAGVVGLGWLAFEFVHVRGILKPDVDPITAAQTLERADKEMEALFEANECFSHMESVTYRANNHQYLVRFTVAGSCTNRAKALCKEVASKLKDVVDADVCVFAYDGGGSRLAQWVD